ncbi:hypothetical protein MSSIH_0463 [Methanosarcina siciliae HI350]|uniref:Uncharacterized protein n=1 Tax=Methanosarcina siciliae HI350 TaxID=1434119 RepID=A0A0E3PCE9_9EURY|nr:M12 family metallo-peptidase [Methanosarcina siciliae]AKB31153.1 hypothetical protein MSSIH_0463 [Methanosarcina siciliae HI350]
MIKKKFGIKMLILAILLVSMAFVLTVNAQTEKNSDGVSIENSISYTDAELQDLYIKYNISENDIKFANDELPNYLEGTILRSDKRVVASDTGRPHEGMIKGENYDLLITTEEMFNIIDNARQKYMELYGVDPGNPKLEKVNGYLIPKEEVKKLVEKGTLSYGSEDVIELETEPKTSTRVTTNPYAINDAIDVHVFVATDSTHAPTESFQQDTVNALSRFEDFGIDVYLWWYWNSWDASDVSPSWDASAVLNDLEDDESWVRYSASDLVLGWAHELNHNGIARVYTLSDGTLRGGAYSVCTDTVYASSIEWPHDSIVQHEISHNFDAEEGGTFKYQHPAECIMNYEWAYEGTNIWCSSCSNVVNNGIWN